SRRRHTRFSRDWSSDVCSSDLLAARGAPDRHFGPEAGQLFGFWRKQELADEKVMPRVLVDHAHWHPVAGIGARIAVEAVDLLFRSEERRVGKECICRWSRCQ